MHYSFQSPVHIIYFFSSEQPLEIQIRSESKVCCFIYTLECNKEVHSISSLSGQQQISTTIPFTFVVFTFRSFIRPEGMYLQDIAWKSTDYSEKKMSSFIFFMQYTSNNFYIQRIGIERGHWVVVEGKTRGKRKFLVSLEDILCTFLHHKFL